MRLNSFHQKARLSAASAIDQLRTILAKSVEGTVTHQLDLSELEDRILLSASPVAVMVESAPAAESVEVASPLTGESASHFAPVQPAGTEPSDSVVVDILDQAGQSISDTLSQPTPLAAQDEIDNSMLSESSAEQTATEVIFIDEAAEDFEQLVADLESQRDAGRAIDFFVLDSQQDGIDQIAETLEQYADLDAVHIVSHGTGGAVKLGATWLRIGSLDAYAGTIAGWGSAIGTDGDILIYGCDLAANSRGELLVESVAALTGADVAASTDDTGHAIFGGDWDLEYQTGTIEAQIAVTEELQGSWGHLLNVTIDSTSTGTAPSFAGSTTVSHTTSGTDRLMLVGISFGEDKGDTVSSVTYNGVNLTFVGAQDNSVALGSRVEIWSLVNPTVGNPDVVVNFSGTNHIGATIGVMTFNGVDQATALGSFASSEGDSSAPSTTVTSATGEVVFGVLALDHNADIDLTPGAGQTEHWDLFRDKATGGGTTEAGAASVDTSWTLPLSRKWAAGGVSIKPADSNGPLTNSSEFLVNTTTGNTQETRNEDRGSSRAVAVAPNGEYVVVWSSDQNTGSDADGFGVVMQRFDAAGNKLGSELQVNTQTNNDQFHASVAVDDSGRGVVVWTDANSGTGVRARRFDADGTLNGGEFGVNSTTSGDQKNSSVAMDAVGNFVVVWEGNGPGDGSGIFAQRFDASGTKLGSEFRVNDTTSNTQSEPSIAMNSSGEFAVVWDDGSGVHARTFQADGTGGSGSQFTVDGGSSAGQADIGIDDSGKTVVTWRETDGTFGKGVYRRVFAFDGTAQTGNDVVNTQFLFDQTDPSISIAGDGSYIIAWEGTGFTDPDGVAYQKYDSGDSKVGTETVINQTTTGLQSQVSLAMLDLENFVVVWSGEGPGDTTGVFARQYGTGAAPTGELWFTTQGSGGGGSATWNDAEVLQFGDAGDTFDINAGTTGGTISKLPGFVAPYDIRAMHYVESSVTLGTTGTQFTVLEGDLILTLDPGKDVTGDAGGVSVDRMDIVVFRPTVAGDYSAGTYTMLIDGDAAVLDSGVHDATKPYNVHGISLVEKDTLVGGTWLTKGTFLVAHSSKPIHRDIYTFDVVGTGVGIATETTQTELLLSGQALGLDGQPSDPWKLQGLHLLQQTTDFNGASLSTGTLLVTVQGPDTYAGQPQDEFDIVALTVTQTEQDATPGTAATGTLFFDGTDIAIDTATDEVINGFTIISSSFAGDGGNQAPTADTGGPYVINEGDSLNLVGSASSDPDTDPLTYAWDLDNDGNFGEAGEPTTETPTVTWTTLQSFGIDDNGVHTIGLQVDDGNGGVAIATTTVTVTNVAPTLSTTGSGSVAAGSIYTLNLSAVDPGADTITSWTINWGDGDIETFAGNPGSVTHTYNAAGFTFDILASAIDEDGTYLQNQLLAPDYDGDRVYRFAATTGGFLQQFANTDGIDKPLDTLIGPDGNLYVSGETSQDVLRYNAQTGAFIDEFIPTGSSGLSKANGIAFGPDGNLYVADGGGNRVMRFDGTTGAFIDNFVSAGSGGLSTPYGMTFGTDGRLYVNSNNNDNVLRFDSSSGAFIDEFVTSGLGGLSAPEDMTFGPDGNLYIASFGSKEILRYNGTTGAFIDEFVPTGSGGIGEPSGLAFGPDGNLYVTDYQNGSILRYDGTTSAFLNTYVTTGAGGLTGPTWLTFLPEHQVTVSASAIAEQRVNNSTSDAQRRVDVATDATGDHVVVWQSQNQDGDGAGVFAQRYDSAGAKIGGEFQVNTTTANAQRNPRVAMDNVGNFVVTWESEGQDGDSPSETNIYARVYDSAGSAVTGELLVNTTTLNDQENPAVAMNGATGTFMITWAGFDPAGGDWNIFARRFDVTGTPLEAERLVNSTTAGDQVNPDISVDAFAEFGIVWTGLGQDGDAAAEGNIYAQNFKSNGVFFGGEILVNATTTGHQHSAAIQKEHDGDYTIVWVSEGQDGDGAGIFGESIAFGASGNNRHGEFAVNSITAGEQTRPDITSEPLGNFITTWESTGQDGDGPTEKNIYSRIFTVTNSGVAPNAPDFLVNTLTSGDQKRPAIAADDEGDYVVAWQGNGPGDTGGVFSRLYSGALTNTAPEISLANPNLSYTENDSPLVIGATLTVSDPDDINLAGAAVSFRSGFTVGEDVLSFTPVAGITGMYDAASGVLSFSGSASIADYQTVLRTVAYSNTSENPSTVQRQLEFTVDDGVSSSSDVRNINVSADNDQPAGTISDVSATDSDPDLVIDLFAAFDDPDNVDADLTFTVTGNTTAGIAGTSIDNVAGTLTLSFTPTQAGTTNITVRATDPGSLFGEATFTVTVAASNVAPTSDAGGPYAVSEGASVSLDGSASTDSDGTITLYEWDLDYDGVTFNGTATGVSPSFSAASIDGPDSRTIALRVTDNLGAVSGIATSSVTINNASPLANADTGAAFTTNEETPFTTGNVLANDTDVPVDVLAETSLDTTGTTGLVTSNGDGTFNYNPNGQFETLAAGQQTTDTFSYEVSDDDGGSDTTTVTITLNGVNDAPVVNAGQTFSVLESASNGTPVGTVSATDIDALTTFSNWMITSGDPAGVFAINASTGQITIADNSTIDFDTAPTSYSLSVTVSDGTSTSAVETVTINLTDVNDIAPVIDAAQSFNIAENIANSAVVGTVTATDADTTGEPRQDWMITGGDPAGVFAINASTGQITIADNSTIDFDSAPTSYALSVTVSDGTKTSAVETVTINLADVNDIAPVIDSAQSFNIAENIANSAVVGTVTASDADTTGEPRQNWMITGGDPVGVFAINGSTGQITITDNSTIDFESAPTSYSLSVTVSDGTSTSAVETVTINLTDVNDIAPVIDAAQLFSIAENSDNASVVGTVTATDADTTGELRQDWMITGGDPVGVFAINGATGQITIVDNSTIDFESAPTSYALSVTTSDGTNASAAETVTISLTDANDIAPVVDPTQSFNIAENIANASVVGTVTASDADTTGEPRQNWMIAGGDPAGVFAINASTGQITIADNSTLDFESASTSYALSVTTSDGTNTSAAETVTINLTDANDEAPVILSGQSFSIAENVANTSVVGTVVATDADAGDSLTWSITGGNPGGTFAVNSATGQIAVASNLNLDFETTPTFNVTLRVEDAVGAFDTAIVTVSLLNQNESPEANDAALTIKEDDAPGASLGVVTGFDPDAGDTLTWSILSGNTNGAFSLRAVTGELTVASPSTLDFETTPTYTLNVQIQDAGGLTDSAVVVVNVSNANEAPTTTGLADVAVNEDSADVIVDLKTAFSDIETPAAALSYSIVGNSNPTLFSGTPIVGGNLILKFALNANGNAIVAVRATDLQGLFVTTAFNVVVAPVADAPTSSPDLYAVRGDQLTVVPASGVLANDSDPDGDALSALLVSGPANGSLVLLSNGGFTYTPDAEFTGIDSFVYEPFDGASTGPQRTVVLNVVRVIASPPPPPTATESSESAEAASTSESEAGETAEATVEAPLSATTVAVSVPDVNAAEAETSPEDTAADENTEEVRIGAYAATESDNDFFSDGSQRMELRDATSVSVKTLNAATPDRPSPESENRFRDSLRFDGEDLSYLVGTEFIRELEQVENKFEFDAVVPEWATGTAVATTASISVGYIMWMLRGGYVLASVLSTMPVWQNIDPLPVLAALEDADDGDDDSLETMIDRASDEADDSETSDIDKAASDAERKDEIV